MRAKVSQVATYATVLGALLVIPLAVAPTWYSQTETPKRLLWQGLALLLTTLTFGLSPHVRRLNKTELLALISFLLMGLWMFLAWPFALSIRPGWLALSFVLSSLLWFASLLLRPMSASLARAMLLTLVGAALLAALVGLVQDGLDHGDRFPFTGSVGTALWAPLLAFFEFLDLGQILQTDRPGSLFGHTNVAAEFICACTTVLGVFLAVMVAEKRSRFRRAKSAFGLLVSLPLALFLVRSGSRGAIFALAAGLAFGGVALVIRGARTRPWFGGVWRHVAACTLGVALLFSGLALVAQNLEVRARFGQRPVSLAKRLSSSFDEKNTTVRERLDLWANTAEMIKDRPLFGVGAGGFPVAYPDWARSARKHEKGRLGLSRQPERPHNEYLRLAAEGGLPALFFFLVGTFLVLGWGLSCYWRLTPQSDDLSTGRQRAILLASMAGMVAILASAVVGFPFTQTATTLVFFSLAALSLQSSSVLSRPSSARKSLPSPKGVAQPVSSPSAPMPLSSPLPTSPNDLTLSKGWRVITLSALILISAVMFFGLRAQAKSSKDLGRLRSAIATDRPEIPRMAILRKLRHVDAAAARQPANYRTQLLRADSLLSLGRHQEALNAVDLALSVHPRLVNAYVQRCEIALAMGNESLAFDAATEAQSLQPESARVQLAMARVNHRMGQAAEAHTRLLSALRMTPTPPVRLRIYLELAVMATQRSEAVDAALLLSKAEKLAPGDSRVAEARAFIRQHLSAGSAGAFAAWEKVLEQEPLHPEALMRVGLHHLVTGEAEEALRCFEWSFEVNPSQTMLLYHRARALRMLGRLPEANTSIVACLHRAGKLGGDMATWNRAWQLGRLIQAELKSAEDSKKP